MQVVVIGLRHLQALEQEMQALLAGILAALVSVAVHNLGDPFGGHVVEGMLWLHVALIIAICRSIRTDTLATGGESDGRTAVRFGASRQPATFVGSRTAATNAGL